MCWRKTEKIKEELEREEGVTRLRDLRERAWDAYQRANLMYWEAVLLTKGGGNAQGND